MGTWFAEGGVRPCYGNVVCGGWGQSLLWERGLRRVGSDLAMGTLFAEGGVSPCYGNVVCGGWGQTLLWERGLRRVGSVIAMGTLFVEGGVSHCYGNVVCNILKCLVMQCMRRHRKNSLLCPNLIRCLQHYESTVFHLGVNKNIESVAYIMQTASNTAIKV